MGGTPSNWRTADSDADRNPAFLDVWLNDFDAISPWTVGRYNNEQEADGFFEGRMKVDWEVIKKRNDEGGGARKVDYIPVVLPGGSVSFPLILSSFPLVFLILHIGRATISQKENGDLTTSNATVVVSCGNKSQMLNASGYARCTAQCGTS